MTFVDNALEVVLAEDVVFRRVFDESPSGRSLIDTSGRIVRVNDALCRFLGRSTDELLGMTLTDVTDPRDLTTDLDLVGQLFAGAIDSYDIDKRYLRPDGSSVWGRLTAWLLRDGDGGPLYGLGRVQDIDAEKAAQAEVERERQRLDLALSVASIAVWEADLQTRRIVSSANLAEVYGAPVATLDEFLDRVHPADQEVVRQGIDVGARPMPDAINTTFRTVTTDGDVRWIHVRGTILRDAGGRPVSMIGTALDVSVTRAAVQGRMRMERLHRRTLQLARDAYLAVGADGRIVEWNEAATDLFGWTAREAIGRLAARDLFPDAAARPHWVGTSTTELFDAEGGHQVVHATAVDRAGRRFPVDVTASILEDGGERSVRAFLRDATERLRAERALAAAATTDALTGVANRQAVLDAMATSRAVVLVRLDGVNDVNRRLGLAAGDTALREAASRLAAIATDGAVVGRFGGTTFAFACETTARATAIAGAVERCFQQPIALGAGETVRLPAVTAKATATTKGTTPDALVLEAEALLRS